MSKRPSDEALRAKMNNYAGLLLDAHYGHLLMTVETPSLPGAPGSATTAGAGELPKADVFNAVVNWLRTDSGMEPIAKEKSGIAALAEQRANARK